LLNILSIGITVPRQVICSPGNTFTSPQGLNFVEYCNQNILGFDFDTGPLTLISSLEDCMTACEESRPPCYGVTYNPANQCYLKTFGITNDSIVDELYAYSAVADAQQLQALNETCPATNLSTLSLSQSNLQYDVLCGVDIAGDDYCTADGICKRHAPDLASCVRLCSEAHPLCQRVAFDPTLSQGYDNCYLKNAADAPLVQRDFVIHSASLLLPSYTYSCSDGDFYTSTTNANKVFTIACGGNAPGNDINQVHSDTIEDCTDQCAAHTECTGVSFQPSMIYGYMNCWLKTAVNFPLIVDETYITSSLNSNLSSSIASTPTASSASSSLSGTLSSTSSFILGTSQTSSSPTASSVHTSRLDDVSMGVGMGVGFGGLIIGLLGLYYAYGNNSTMRRLVDMLGRVLHR
jgi:hypothetical protein